MYRIQILDESSNTVLYFDRIKASYGSERIITSANWGKNYNNFTEAERDVEIIRSKYPEYCVIEIIEVAMK